MTRTPDIAVGVHRYTAQDARKTLGCLDELWRHHRHATAANAEHDELARRFISDIAEVASVPAPALHDVDTAFAGLTAALGAAFADLDLDHDLDRDRIARILEATWDVFPRLRRLDHHHDGTVASLQASKGLPKKTIETADIGWRGIRGDVRRARAHHGRPWQALCLWSTDALDTLRDEGHPIGPGCAGENITVSGIPAGAFRPGARFRIGSVEGFLTSYTIPCSKISGWFSDGDSQRIHFERGDESRIYAMVSVPGSISVGDGFELISDR